MFNLYRYFKNKYYRNKEIVGYWKRNEVTKAKLTKAPEGHYIMVIPGEKYPFPGYPRGALLSGTKPGEHGKLSVLKHEIKNQIFNEIWHKLDAGTPEKEIWAYLNRGALPRIFATMDSMRYDPVPYELLVPPLKEFWRAFEVVEKRYNSKRVKYWKEILSFIFQEDDAYRMRFQWMIKIFNPSSLSFRMLRKDPISMLGKAFDLLEHAEVVGDMKERVRLWKRGTMFMLQDPDVKACFLALCEEMHWNKLKLSKADKYYFRGKYFKVDYPEYQY